MKNNITRFKTTTWFDTKRNVTQYGINVRVNGKWVHLCEGTNNLIFDTEQEAKEKIKEYKKQIKVL